MGRYLIKEVKCDTTNGGMACGPVFGAVVASIQFENEGEEKWLHVVEVEGMPNTYINKEDIFDVLVQDNYGADFIEDLESSSDDTIGGIVLTGDYGDIIYELVDGESASEEDKSFIRFVLAIIRCDWDVIKELKDTAIGHYTDEINIPISDVEEEYLEDQEDDRLE